MRSRCGSGAPRRAHTAQPSGYPAASAGLAPARNRGGGAGVEDAVTRLALLVAATLVAAATAAAATPAPQRTVPCTETIDGTRFPYTLSGYRTVLNAVSVPPSYLAQIE